MNLTMTNRQLKTPLLLLACLVALALSGCTPAPETPKPLSTQERVTEPLSTEPLSAEPPAAETEPAPGDEPAAAATERLPAGPLEPDGVASKLELPASATAAAAGHLAARLNVKLADIHVERAGEWTNAPVDCELDLANPRQELLLQGEHLRVELAYKDRTYVYWVFRSGGDQFLPAACR